MNKPPTIPELQKQFTEAVQRVNGHARVMHYGQSTCGNRVIFESATAVKLPHGIPLKPLAEPFKAVVERFYAPVIRVEIEKPYTEGCDSVPGRLWQNILFIHE